MQDTNPTESRKRSRGETSSNNSDYEDLAKHLCLLNDFSSSPDVLRKAIKIVGKCAKFEEPAHLIVQSGAIRALVGHLSATSEGNGQLQMDKVKKGCARVLASLASSESEHRQLIVDAGALPHLINILRRHRDGQFTNTVIGAMRRAADAIKNLAQNNSSIQSRVRNGGGIPPLVKLLEFPDSNVQRAAAWALETLSYNNTENKRQIVECNAFPALILLLCSENITKHCEAVSVIEHLINMSPRNVNKAFEAGALQPVIRLLSSPCIKCQRGAALILGHFALTETNCKVHIVQRGAVGPLIELVQSQDVKLQIASAFVLGMLAQDTHNRAGIVHSGGIVPLLNLLDSNSGPVQQNAAFALCELANNEDNVVSFITAGGVPKLEGGEFLLQQTRHFVSKTLDRLEDKINGRVLSHLLYLMRVADRSIQRRIILALAHLCSPNDQKSIFLDSSGLDILLKLLASRNLKLQQVASAALYKLAEKTGSLFPADASPAPSVSPIYLGEEFVNNPQLSDVTFLIEGRRFHAYRVWLVAASNAFREMFANGYMEGEALEIEISNIKWEVFELMIRYIYTGSAVVRVDVAHDLLKAANEYHLDGLKHMCERTITEQIHAENLSLTYELSEACNSMVLRDACIVFVLAEFGNLIALPWFPHLISSIIPKMRDFFVRELSRPVRAE